MKEISKHDKRIKVIINSRNYGVFPSTYNAIIRSSGDAVVPMLPLDLQDPPEKFQEMFDKWSLGYDVVYGVRKSRKENFFKKII